MSHDSRYSSLDFAVGPRKRKSKPPWAGGIRPALFPRSAWLKSFNSRARDERINKISRFLLYNKNDEMGSGKHRLCQL